MAELVWQGTDGLDKYRLISQQTGETATYQLERSQQTDSLGVDIWHVYAEIPGGLAVLLLKESEPVKLRDVQLPNRGTRIEVVNGRPPER